jgi:hypothetical protein
MSDFGASPTRALDTVECRSDSEDAERPLSLIWQGTRMEIAEIIATWRGPGEKGFRIKTADGVGFDLAYHVITDEWQIQPL